MVRRLQAEKRLRASAVEILHLDNVIVTVSLYSPVYVEIKMLFEIKMYIFLRSIFLQLNEDLGKLLNRVIGQPSVFH